MPRIGLEALPVAGVALARPQVQNVAAPVPSREMVLQDLVGRQEGIHAVGQRPLKLNGMIGRRAPALLVLQPLHRVGAALGSEVLEVEAGVVLDLADSSNLSLVIEAVEAHRVVEHVPGLAAVPGAFADGVIAELDVVGLPSEVEPEAVIDARDQAAHRVAVAGKEEDRVVHSIAAFHGIGRLLPKALRPAPDADRLLLRRGVLGGDGPEVGIHVGEVRRAVRHERDVVVGA